MSKRKRYSESTKNAAIEAIAAGEPVAKVAERIGCDPKSIYAWVRPNATSKVSEPENSRQSFDVLALVKELETLDQRSRKTVVDILVRLYGS